MEQRSETRLRYQCERSRFRGRSFGSQNPDLGMQPCLEVSMGSKRFRLDWEQKKDRGPGTGFSALAAREMKEPSRSFTCAIF